MHCSTSTSLLLFCVFRAGAAWPGLEVHLPSVSSPSQRTAQTIPTSTDQGEQIKKAVDGMVKSSRRGMQSGKAAVQSARQQNWDHARDMAEDSVQNYEETERKARDALRVTDTLPEEGRSRVQKFFFEEVQKVSKSLTCARNLLGGINLRQQPIAPCLHLHPAPQPQQPAPMPVPHNASAPTPVPQNATPRGPDLGEQLKKTVDAMVESSRRGMQSGKAAVQSALQQNWDHARDMAEDSVQNYEETERKARDALRVADTLPEEGRSRVQKFFLEEVQKVRRSLDCARILLKSIIRRQQPVASCLHLHPTPKPQQPAPTTIPQKASPRRPVSQSAPRQQREPAAAQNSAEPLHAQAVFSVGSKDIVPTNRAWQHAVPFVFTTFGLVALFTAGLAVARHRRHSMAGPLEAHSELITETSLEAVE